MRLLENRRKDIYAKESNVISSRNNFVLQQAISMNVETEVHISEDIAAIEYSG